MTASLRPALAALAMLALAACTTKPLVGPDEREAIAQRLMTDIAYLASDELGGRRPGTDGGRLAVEHIIAQMSAAGLQPGTNDPGDLWRAPVVLLSVEPKTAAVSITGKRGSIVLQPDEFVARARESRVLIEDVPVVFAGYEAGRVPRALARGNIILTLADGEATFIEPRRDPRIATALSVDPPAAHMIVTSDQDQLERLREAETTPRLSLAQDGSGIPRITVSESALTRVLGPDRWASLKRAAQGDDFAPILLDATAELDIATMRREIPTYNVIGCLAGDNPDAGAVLLLAHWDHLGTCGSANARDAVCNGAIDNASGVAMMLELARRLKASGPHDRDIYFLATTAEESGLLGARAFLANPPIPLDTIVAAFNFDTAAVAPAGSAVGFVGEGRTGLDPVIREVLGANRRAIGDRAFAESFVTRQDGWALLSEGVPAVLLSTSFGSRDVLQPYLDTAYHQPGDEWEGIELGGAIDDLLLHEELVRRFASTEQYDPASSERASPLDR